MGSFSQYLVSLSVKQRYGSSGLQGTSLYEYCSQCFMSSHGFCTPSWISQIWKYYSPYKMQIFILIYNGKTIVQQISGDFFFFFFFLGPHLRHVEVPRLGDKSELQLPVYATATVTQDPSHVCDLHQSSQQPQILNPLSKARDPNHVLMDTSQVC